MLYKSQELEVIIFYHIKENMIFEENQTFEN